MAEYLVPTFDDFVQRFPEFAGEDEYLVTYLLTVEATRMVDESWLVGDYAIAIMYYVAHLITAQSNPTAAGGGQIQSESFGPISTTYATRAITPSSHPLISTEFGRQFLELQLLNHPPVIVIRGRC